MNSKNQLLKLFTLIIFFTFCQSAISKTKETNYLRDGISFSLPENWKIIANDSIDHNAYYFSAERTGKGATGLITIVWINQIEKPNLTLDGHQKSMKSSNIYRNPGIIFTPIRSDIFAGQKAQSCQYTTIVKDLKLNGTIYCFNAAQKTISIFFQSGIKDLKINFKAFDLVQETFNCRE